jgi:hypothetical protein
LAGPRSLVRRLAFWVVGQDSDVAEFVRTCQTCQRAKAEHGGPQDLLHRCRSPLCAGGCSESTGLRGLRRLPDGSPGGLLRAPDARDDADGARAGAAGGMPGEAGRGPGRLCEQGWGGPGAAADRPRRRSTPRTWASHGRGGTDRSTGRGHGLPEPQRTHARAPAADAAARHSTSRDASPSTSGSTLPRLRARFRDRGGRAGTWWSGCARRSGASRALPRPVARANVGGRRVAAGGGAAARPGCRPARRPR